MYAVKLPYTKVTKIKQALYYSDSEKITVRLHCIKIITQYMSVHAHHKKYTL